MIVTSSDALVTTSFLLLVVIPGATSSVLVPHVIQVMAWPFAQHWRRVSLPFLR